MTNKFLQNSKIVFFRRQTNILSAAVILMVMIFASAFLGLIRDRLLAGGFFSAGQQWQLDVYFASFRIPDMLFQVLIMGTLSAAFIPVFSEYLTNNEKEAYEFSASILNIGLIIYLAVTVVVFIFARPIAELMTQLDLTQLNLMVNLMRILLIAQTFFVVSNFFTGILQSNQRFLLPAAAAVLYNLGIIFGIVVLTPKLGIYGPVIGVVFGAMLHGLIQLPAVSKLGFKFNWRFNFHHPGVKRVGHLMIPRTLSFALDQINLNVAVYIATYLTAGSLALYNFAQHLNNLPVSLFGLTIGQAALPSLARAANSNKENFRHLFVDSLHQVLYLSLPASIMLLVLRIPAVRLAFGAKAFPWGATILTGQIVGIMAISIFAQAVIELFIRSFYALQDTATPLILKTVTAIVNVFLSFWLVFSMQMGILGLALAISLTNFLQAILLYIFLALRVDHLFEREVIMPMVKIFGATILAGLFLWLPMRFLDRYLLDTTRTINLIVLIVIVFLLSGGVYLLCSLIFKVEQLASFLTILKRFGQWRKILAESQEVLDEK